MSLENLWDNITESQVVLPETIATKAIEGFNQKTLEMKKNLYFDLRRTMEKEYKRFELLLLAPELGGYSLLVSVFDYPVSKIYPCSLYNCLDDNRSRNCVNSDEFEQGIIAILGSELMQNAIAALLSQCKEDPELKSHDDHEEFQWPPF